MANKQKARRRTNRPTRGRRGRRPDGASRRRVRSAIVSQLDAFAPSAKGAKQFDANSTLSNTAQIRAVKTITTDANGSAAFQVVCLPSASWRQAGTIVSDVVTVEGSWAQLSQGNYVTGHQACRVVTMGVRLFNIATADVAQGIIKVGSSSYPQDAQDYSDYHAEQDFYPLTGGFRKKWVSKPRGTHHADFFTADTTLAEANGDVGGLPWTTLEVFISGAAASTAVLGVEICLNIECIPKSSNSQHGMTASKGWPHMPSIVNAVSSVWENHPHVVEAAEAVGIDYATGGTIAKAIGIDGAVDAVAGFFSGAGAVAAGAAETGLELLPLALL